ncbi:50S ribosomal protein L18 [Candidatus Giovannonibacteria bacterium]|nr:50S ribosomal protein L18 [Candidatus Giovannonibacteria bacterium]
MKTKSKNRKRIVRHRRIRARISGSAARPRLSVFRSSRHLQLQLVDDGRGRTLAGFAEFKIKKGTKSERARNLGLAAAKKILDSGIKKVVFDRGGFRYHGRVRALAEGLREGGLEF